MPRIHFSPQRNWMNDPNGLVFHDGRYHLFFQYNPNGSDHGYMSWGHASSTDLATWEEHPVALRYDEAQEIYSGSAVWDGEGSAGFGPALVVLFTSHSRRKPHQAQAVAHSVDGGLTWKQYEGNPVLDRESANFRDPKVLRYSGANGDYWVMAAVEASEQQVVFYRSDDLLDWQLLSEFTAPEVGEGIWECPDLFPLGVDGEEKWVLVVSLGKAPAVGGFGTIYFVGSFDGVDFMPEGDCLPLDHGCDNYAGVSFYGLPDDQRTLLGWMGNWSYARSLPVMAEEPRRGAMTLARRLSLVLRDGRPVLRQEPVVPATRVTGEARGVTVAKPVQLPVSVPVCGRIDVELDLGEASGARLRLRHGANGERGVVLGYDAGTGEVSLDRSDVSAGFPHDFLVEQRMPTSGGRWLALRLWTDLTSVELFADDGTAVLTSLVDVAAGDGLTVEGIGGEVTVSARVSTPVGDA